MIYLTVVLLLCMVCRCQIHPVISILMPFIVDEMASEMNVPEDQIPTLETVVQVMVFLMSPYVLYVWTRGGRK